MRLGIAGAGIMGARLLEAAALVEGVEITALAERDPARRQRLAATTQCAVFDGWEDLVEQAGIDAVYIGLPHHLHAQAAVAAARRGLHLLVDKPLCNTLAEADEILAAVQAGGVTLMVGFSHRFHVELQAAKAALDRGDLGTPLLASDVLVDSALDSPAWYWSRDAGGGVLQLQAHHSFDRLAWLVGSRIVSVRADSVVLPGDEVERVATVSLRFASGALGTIALSFAEGYDGRSVVELVIQGSHGHLRLDTWHSLEVDTATAAYVQRQQRDDWLRKELAEFAGAVREGREPLAGGSEGRRALECALAAAESARTGRTVEIGGAT
jgi:predicted dehydrogenase